MILSIVARILSLPSLVPPLIQLVLQIYDDLWLLLLLLYLHLLPRMTNTIEKDNFSYVEIFKVNPMDYVLLPDVVVEEDNLQGQFKAFRFQIAHFQELLDLPLLQ